MVKLLGWDILMWRDGRDEKRQRADCEPDVRQWLTAGTGLMTLATMHAKLCVCVCLCMCVWAQGLPSFFQNNKLYACTVTSGQGSLLHVMAGTQNHTEECELLSEGKRSLRKQFGMIWSLKMVKLNKVKFRTVCEDCPGTVDRNGASPSVVCLSDVFSLLFAGF